MAENILEKEHQLFIVQQLAMFERPRTVQAKLKEIYDIEISLPGIQHYQITSKQLSKELRKIFNATRKKFLKDTSAIPISNINFRLQKLNNILDKLEDEPIQNTVEMRATLEQASKEAGGVFTNRQKIEHRVTDVRNKSDDELEQRRAELLKKSK